MKQIIAERQLLGINPSGEKLLITLRLGAPYQSSDVDWACPVEAEGLYTKLVDIHGIDSFQALMLAISLLKGLLGGFVEKGGKLLWPDGDKEEVNLEELFASRNGPAT
jgi:hypothetical protein